MGRSAARACPPQSSPPAKATITRFIRASFPVPPRANIGERSPRYCSLPATFPNKIARCGCPLMTTPQGRQPIKQRPYGKPLTRTRLPNYFASLLPPSLPRGWLRFGRRELTISFYWFAVTDSDYQHPASKAVLWPKQIEPASYTPPFHSQPSGNVTEECSRCCTLSATFPDKRDSQKNP